MSFSNCRFIGTPDSYLTLASYELKDAVALFYGSTVSVVKWHATGNEDQASHQDVRDSEEVERSIHVDEKKREASDADRKSFPEAFAWKISASVVPKDLFVAFVFP